VFPLIEILQPFDEVAAREYVRLSRPCEVFQQAWRSHFSAEAVELKQEQDGR